MTYTHTQIRRVDVQAGSTFAHLMKPTTLAVELDASSFYNLQRGDVLEMAHRGVSRSRVVTWTVPVLDSEERVVSVMAGLGDEVGEGQG